MVSVGAGYFDTLGVRLVRGRAFDDADGLPGHETRSSTSGSSRCTSPARIRSAGESA